MPPRRDPNLVDSDSNSSNPIQDLAFALHEVLKSQQHQNPDPFRLDTRVHLPKFVGQSNGEAKDSWICSLSTYFDTCPDITEAINLQIAALQLEGTAQVWWDTQREKDSFLIELGSAGSSTPSIKKWDQLCEAFRNHFYPPGYIQSIWIRWHQLGKLPTQGVQAYIDYFSKLYLLLHIPDLDEVLILKFMAGLLVEFHREVELF